MGKKKRSGGRRENAEADEKAKRRARGRKYSNDDDDDDDDVLHAAVMAPFYHDYRAAILHATRCRYSSLQFLLLLFPLFASSFFLTFAPLKLPFRRTLPSLRRQSPPPQWRYSLHLLAAATAPRPFVPRCHLTLDALLSSGLGCIRKAQKSATLCPSAQMHAYVSTTACACRPRRARMPDGAL